MTGASQVRFAGALLTLCYSVRCHAAVLGEEPCCAADTNVLLQQRHESPSVRLAELIQLSDDPSMAEYEIDEPRGQVVDVNFGTNFSPMKPTGDNFLVLVDPLPDVCDKLSSHMHDNKHVAVLCCAVSNYTGTAQFLKYNSAGISSSLTPTTNGTSHERFAVDQKFTVKVMKAADILAAYLAKGNRVYKLKTDMQGSDMTALKNLRPILSMPDQVTHIKSECFIPDAQGRQIYQIDNNCATMKAYLEGLGYTVKMLENRKIHPDSGDVYAFKAPATNYLDLQDWDGPEI
ncbi:splA [Symbiodinium sp. CCMP2592]|nr:splA [Symbiodinium sp. CCMP2592]